MIRLFVLACVLALLPLTASALQVEVKPTLTTAGGNIQGTAILAKGYTTATFHVCCAFNATVTFKATVDGTNFEPLGCVPVENQSALVASTTLRGIWRCNVIGLTQIRADISQYVSGVINVNVGMTAAGVS